MPTIPACAAADARAPGPRDMPIDILYGGVRRSGIHQARVSAVRVRGIASRRDAA